MKIGIPLTGRSLSENVYKSFEKSPFFAIYNLDRNSFEYIENHCRNESGLKGVYAAQIMADKGIQAVIAGELEDECIALFLSNSIDVYKNFSGIGKNAIESFKNSNIQPAQKERIINRISLKKFIFISKEHAFKGDNLFYEDWDFIRPMDACTNIPTNWINPVNFSDGFYLMEIKIDEMKTTREPVEIEFGMFNHPEKIDPKRLERCSFGHYCRFNKSGNYSHIAMLNDMEVTTIKSNERLWEWSNAWYAPFVLVKPYNQDPYPIEVAVKVSIYESEIKFQ